MEGCFFAKLTLRLALSSLPMDSFLGKNDGMWCAWLEQCFQTKSESLMSWWSQFQSGSMSLRLMSCVCPFARFIFAPLFIDLNIIYNKHSLTILAYKKRFLIVNSLGYFPCFHKLNVWVTFFSHLQVNTVGRQINHFFCAVNRNIKAILVGNRFDVCIAAT